MNTTKMGRFGSGVIGGGGFRASSSRGQGSETLFERGTMCAMGSRFSSLIDPP